MLYEYVFFLSILLGLTVGHLLTLRLSSRRTEALKVAGKEWSRQEVTLETSGTPCCNNATTA